MLIDLDGVKALLPVSRTTIYVLMKRKRFPRPVKILTRSLWDAAKVRAWIRRQSKAAA